jgi:DNA (cytosine-5)-methyltransferase 1
VNNSYRKRSAKGKMHTTPTKVVAVDLFCGVGGLTKGLAKGGIAVTTGFDLDTNCKFAYEKNNHSVFVERDIRHVKAADVSQQLQDGTFSLIAGCAPCQPFSTYNGKKRAANGKWNLLAEFGRLVREVQPDLVTMENVPRLCNEPVFHEFLSSLSGYHVSYEIVSCSNYGIPQTRKRLVLLASRLGTIQLVPPTHKKPRTVRHTIQYLPPLVAGETSFKDALHCAPSLSPKNLSRIRLSKPGGTWGDWPKQLQATCHSQASGKSYKSVYGRMTWDEPSPTITTMCFGFGNGRFGHPEQDRAISLREAALLQTFPKSYKFLRPGEKARFNVLGRLIGNAVPVRLGEVIAQSINRHLETIDPTRRGKAA